MDLKKLRQILKALGDDNRLRIVNLLKEKELTVSELCVLLKMSQPAVSRHLTRLRLLKIVLDRREANRIFYRLNSDSDQGRIIRFILSEFRDITAFNKDRFTLSSGRKSRT